MSSQNGQPRQQLPPLILHPFSGGNRVEDLLEGSRATLALNGLIDSEEEERVLRDRMLLGRYQEIRMLIFLGKDVFRWLNQCVESLRNREEDPRIIEQSFAALLVESPPDTVRRKLEIWGVTDRRAVFSRAIGMHGLFEIPPPPETLSSTFLLNYHRFADHAYICFQHLHAFLPLDATQYHFDLFASEEYARMLSEQWESAGT
jgi:hypothetical protein